LLSLHGEQDEHHSSTTNNNVEFNGKNNDSDGIDSSEEQKQPSPRMGIQFKCKICDNVLRKTFTKQSYEHGVVIIRCDFCINLHLIADNLGWFSDLNGKKNIVDILHAKGEKVYRITSADDPKLIQENQSELEQNKTDTNNPLSLSGNLQFKSKNDDQKLEQSIELKTTANINHNTNKESPTLS